MDFDQLITIFNENAWIGQIFFVVFGALLIRYVIKILFDRLAKQLEKTNNRYDDILLAAGRKPVGWAVWILGVLMAAEIIGKSGGAEIFTKVSEIREVAIIYLLIWFLVRFVRAVEREMTTTTDENRRIDVTTASAVGKLVRASLVITGVLVAMQTLGFSVSGVLAFGGIGGIAIGFAARDLLANFFGAFMIFMDRPFAVGDWIRSPDREIEGTVEDIGWRLTRIRTFDQRPLYVPNSVFSSLPVENPSRMSNRRIKETIGLRYDDVKVLELIVADTEHMLQNHPDIAQDKTLMVNFVTFGPSSLDFFIYTFTKTTVWAEFHKIKQDVLLKIAAIIESHGAEIAFPTQTIALSTTDNL